MNRFIGFFDLPSLSRRRIFLHGFALLLLNLLGIVIYALIIRFFPLTAEINSVEYRIYAVVLTSVFVTLLFVVFTGAWFCGKLLRPLSWYTPVGLVLLCLAGFLALLDNAIAMLAYGQVLYPGSRLFGD